MGFALLFSLLNEIYYEMMHARKTLTQLHSFTTLCYIHLFFRPKCYHEKLYNYGKTCIQNFWNYPNVIAGVVGNEVMNDLDAWSSAPCLKAYLDDLARYGKSLGSSSDSGGDVGRKALIFDEQPRGLRDGALFAIDVGIASKSFE